MAFCCGQNCTDGKKTCRKHNNLCKSKLVTDIECNKKNMSLDLQNMCSWTEKNPKQMLWLQTQVEILNLSRKKYASRVEKKKTWVEKERMLTSCVVSQCLH